MLLWSRITEQVLFKEGQSDVRQLTLGPDASTFLAVSRPSNPAGVETTRATATLILRSLPGEAFETVGLMTLWGGES